MKRLLVISTIALLSNAAFAAPDTTLTKSLHDTERVVNSLRMDKPSQMRVYAFDGTEYTSAEVLWLKAHVQAARKALASNNVIDAKRELNLVATTLKSRSATAGV